MSNIEMHGSCKGKSFMDFLDNAFAALNSASVPLVGLRSTKRMATMGIHLEREIMKLR